MSRTPLILFTASSRLLPTQKMWKISKTEHAPEPPVNLPEKKHRFFEYNPDYDYSSDPVAVLFIKSDLRLVVDLQNNVKSQQSRAYAQKVKISNLQQMAKTIAYVQEHHYDTRENLQMTFDDISEKCKEARNIKRKSSFMNPQSNF